MVRRVLRLWAMYGYMDLIWMLKDVRTFAVYTITEVVVNLSAVTGIWLIASRFAGIGNLTLHQVVFLLGYSLAVSGLNNTMFGYNTLHISRIIGRGQLDHILLQPQPIWVSLITLGFLPASASQTLITGLAVLVWVIPRLGLVVTPLWLALLAVSIVCSAGIAVFYSFIWGSSAFRSPAGAEEVCTSVVDLFSAVSNMPLGGLPLIWQRVMLSVLPVGLTAWFPCLALLSPEPMGGLGFLLAAFLTFGALTLAFFQKGLNYYVRAGAYRYHDRGHRR